MNRDWLPLLAAVLLSFGCGDDADPPAPKPDASHEKPDASHAKPDASDAKPDASDSKPDASASKPDGSVSKPDASVAKECPASGEPAKPGCPCKRPEGDYCCSIGSGMTCGSDKIWQAFDDGPCDASPENDGGAAGWTPRVPIIMCKYN